MIILPDPETTNVASACYARLAHVAELFGGHLPPLTPAAIARLREIAPDLRPLRTTIWALIEASSREEVPV